MLTLATIWIVSIIIVAALAMNAPDGFETEDGFFYGKPPEGD